MFVDTSYSEKCANFELAEYQIVKKSLLLHRLVWISAKLRVLNCKMTVAFLQYLVICNRFLFLHKMLLV